MKRLRFPGLYEDLLTAAIEAEVETRTAQGWHLELDQIDAGTLAEFLARHVYFLLRRALDGIPGDGEKNTSAQIALANQLVDVLQDYGIDAEERVATAAQLLLGAVELPRIGDAVLMKRPSLSVSRTGLLVNASRDAQIASEVAREISSADRIDLLCAFIRFSGLRLFRSELESRIQEGAKVRVITSVYTGTTERSALDELVRLGAEVKVSYDVSRTRLHAKAWLFHRNSGLHTAYIGSSNLTHTAQVDGLEWNVRVSAVENPSVVERFDATFEQYWQEPEFEDYDANDRSHVDKLDRALASHTTNDKLENPFVQFLAIDVTPKPHQAVALEALESERIRGHYRNLVVAATGTGKTWISAFDFKRLLDQKKVNSLLFVAHRDEILRQSQQVFQHVLRQSDFGERLVGGERPQIGQFVFASIQSLANRIDELNPDDYEVVIVDEFHHAAAASYDRLLSHLNPRILLGMTATPERADGRSVLEWFDGRIAYESRLWDALDQGLLCPFHYFGVNDPTDISTVRFERGRYLPGDLDNVFTGDHMRAKRILQALENLVADPRSMRALGFCAGVNHARFMAERFNLAGFSAVALDARTPNSERRAAVGQLRRGEIHAIFTVDLFNEGVDIPEVDTILLLRPTESATVFLQQLGRGLRWHDTKQVLTVLDFVGQARKEYRYDVRYRALIGGTTLQIRDAVESDFPLLPPGCVIKLDRIAKDTVLKNLKKALRESRARMVEELQNLPADTRLREFMEATGFGIENIYARPSSGHSFTELRQKAGYEPATGKAASKDPIMRSIGRLLHVDDLERLDLWREIFESGKTNSTNRLSERERRIELMLFACLGGRNELVSESSQVISNIRQRAGLCNEICDLLGLLSDRVRTVAMPLDPGGAVPLASHATYSLSEIMAAFHRTTSNKLERPQAGVLWDKTTRTELLFVTLEKSDKDFSPTTRYEDYPISDTLFHWES